MSRRVLARKHLPSQYPLHLTVLYWLAMDYWHAPGWAWGCVGTLLVAIWAVVIHGVMTETEVELP